MDLLGQENCTIWTAWHFQNRLQHSASYAKFDGALMGLSGCFTQDRRESSLEGWEIKEHVGFQLFCGERESVL